MKNFFAECPVAESDLKVVVEESSKVCYAYLCRKHQIVGDVWLYNKHGVSLMGIFESMRSGLPPANRSGLGQQEVPPLTKEDRLEARHIDVAKREVGLWVNDELWAILWEGSKPGRSRHALRDGPVALTLGGLN